MIWIGIIIVISIGAVLLAAWCCLAVNKQTGHDCLSDDWEAK